MHSFFINLFFLSSQKRKKHFRIAKVMDSHIKRKFHNALSTTRDDSKQMNIMKKQGVFIYERF
jgi:hypothetical protein